MPSITVPSVADSFVFARKTGDKSLTNTSTLEDDNHLLVAVGANATYTFDAFIVYDGATTGDIKVAFTVPAGATLLWSGVGATTGISSAAANFSDTVITASGSAISWGARGAGTKTFAIIRGIVRTAGTAGNLTVQWAQDSSDATATTVFTDSWLTARKAA